MRLPMFPLQTVLVPYGVLPLHVFEQRYRAMVADVLRTDRRFGVVLISRGSEVGGGDQRFAVGTVAEVLDAQQAPDGRWALAAVGTIRLRVREWGADAPYPVADVEMLAEEGVGPSAAAIDEAERAVRRALALQSELDPSTPAPAWERAGDAAAAGWQLVALAPIEALDRQRALEVDDPTERLRLLAALASDRADLLALRLGQG